MVFVVAVTGLAGLVRSAHRVWFACHVDAV